MPFFTGAARKLSTLTNPQVLSRIGDVARGISTAGGIANRLSGGLLKTAVEAIPGGSLALKAAKFGLEKAAPTAEIIGKAAAALANR